MPDGNFPSDSTNLSTQNFQVYEGEAFVVPLWEPKDEQTLQYVEELGATLGILPAKRKTSSEKIILCLSDVLVAVLTSSFGFICWPTARGGLVHGPYGRDIAVPVKDAFEKHRLLYCVRKPRFGGNNARAAIYKIDKNLAPDWLRFKQHDQVPPIEVRDAKPDYRTRSGKKPKGKRISLRRFGHEVEAPLAQMRRILDGMKTQPLEAPEGAEWTRCQRIFNDGRLDSGGRVYGGWQGRKADERLSFTIDGEPVAEIDIKASYLFLASRLSGYTEPLSSDPYSNIKFVQKEPRLRGLAKRLVSTMLSKSNALTKFPQGDKKNENGKVISVKEQFGLPKKAKVADYTSDILRTFPFLHQVKGRAGELMYWESELVLECMDRLLGADRPVVTYPVHDCLICKRSDEPQVVEMLQTVMLSKLGAAPTLDAESLDRTEPTIYPGSHPSSQKGTVQDWFMEVEEDFDLIEDDPL
jgi:hypothetical protein